MEYKFLEKIHAFQFNNFPSQCTTKQRNALREAKYT